MDQDLIDEAIRVATRIADEHGLDLDPTALTKAVLAVTGACNGQDDPAEIAEDALELLGKATYPSSSR